MFYLGLDLGKKRDFTALVIVQSVSDYYGSRLAVRYAERMALGTPYTQVVERVAALSRGHRELNGFCYLTVDATGVGVAVEEALRAAQGGWRGITAVTITGGDRARQALGFGVGEHWNVPRRDLLGGVQLLLEKGELKISAGMRDSRTLVRELLRMRRAPAGGSGRSEAGEPEEHDDLVMALGLACWQASRPRNGMGMQRIL